MLTSKLVDVLREKIARHGDFEVLVETSASMLPVVSVDTDRFELDGPEFVVLVLGDEVEEG